MAAKKQWYKEDGFSKFSDIWQNFYFYRILNENFNMEVEQTNFVIHLIITVQLYYYYLKTRLLKLGQISFKW